MRNYAFLLILEDRLLAPRLALARHVCQPGSRLKPHITVRYPVRLPLDPRTELMYNAAEVEDLYVVGPGSFGLHNSTTSHRMNPAIVFLQCASQSLERIAYKPDFPDSVFHFTLYEGDDPSFACALVDDLQDYGWNFGLSLPKETRLSLVPVGPSARRSSRWRIDEKYLTEAAAMLGDTYCLNGIDTDIDAMSRLSDEQRLNLVRDIFGSLEVPSREAMGSDSVVDSQKAEAIAVRTDSGSLVHLSEVGNGEGVEVLSAHGSDDERSFVSLPMLPELAQEVLSMLVYAMEELGTIDSFAKRVATNSRQLELELRSVVGSKGLDPPKSWFSRNFASLSIPQVPAQPCDLVMGNMVDYFEVDSSKKIKSKLQEELRGALGVKSSSGSSAKRRHRYIFTILQTDRWLIDGGFGLWILPSSFMFSGECAPLRDYLTSEVELHRLHNFGRSVLEHHSQRREYAAVLYRKRKPKAEHLVRWSEGGSVPSPVEDSSSWLKANVSELRKSSSWSYINVMQGRIGVSSLRLDDLFLVGNGLSISPDSPFILKMDWVPELKRLSQYGFRVFPSAETLIAADIDLSGVGDDTLESMMHEMFMPPTILAHLIKDSALVGDSMIEHVRKLPRRAFRYRRLLLTRLERYYRDGIDPRELAKLSGYDWLGQGSFAPILLAPRVNVSDCNDRFPRFVRNCSSGLVLRNYYTLNFAPDVLDALQRRGVSIEDVFALLKQIEEDMFVKHASFHRSSPQRLKIRDVASIAFPQCDLTSHIAKIIGVRSV